MGGLAAALELMKNFCYHWGMAKNVNIYTTPTCLYCQLAKKFLKDNDIEYLEFDVASDRKRAEEMVKKSGQMAVPVIEIGDEIIIGFDKKKISELLGI